MAEQPDIGQVREETRHCDRCNRDIVMTARAPNWRPMPVDPERSGPDDEWHWVCPDCCRRDGLT